MIRLVSISGGTAARVACAVFTLGLAVAAGAGAPASLVLPGVAALTLAWVCVASPPTSPGSAVRTLLLVLAGDFLVVLFLRAKGLSVPWFLSGEMSILVGAALGLSVAVILMTQQMSWIALKMLTGDRAKFFGIVLGLTFAALLITQQGSIFCGLMRRTAGQVEDISGADLWVMDPNVRFIDDVKPMLETSLYRVRGVEGVKWAVPLYKGNARLKLKTTDPAGKPLDVIEQVILLGLDDASLVGAPPPKRILCGSLDDLRKTDAIMIDYNRLRKLYPGERWDQEPQQDKKANLRQAIQNRRDRAGEQGPGPVRGRAVGEAEDLGRGRAEAEAGGVRPPVHRPGGRDERPSRDHRRRVRGHAHVPIQPGGLHALLAGEAVRPART